MIEYAPEQERAALIREALSKEDTEVQRIAAVIIKYAPEHEQVSLRVLVAEKIREALSKENPEVERSAAGMIEYAPEQERDSLIKTAFEAGLGAEVIKPPLYDKSALDKAKFRREEFKKTGSETTLVGGALKGKLIIRHIKPTAFLAWQKIYENYQAWRDAGFDYVPIEPIQSYRLNKKGLVDVFSGVLDLSLARWNYISGGMFMGELGRQRNKIISVLNGQNIEHGHIHHDDNFVLRFFRDEHGNPDLTKTPRVYAIDFDQAVSSQAK